ncbi:MAG: sigma-70 family RNA polymerase sigma factor [Candidatus Levybacteria bacterium]|nr:sigma-70 family RNA polymerase sigma factor [Candidatus Levybacteria bacterium]
MREACEIAPPLNSRVLTLRERLAMRRQAEADPLPESDLEKAFNEVIRIDKHGEPQTLLNALMGIKLPVQSYMRKINPVFDVDADALFQELSIKLARKKESFDPQRGAFENWVFQSAHNMAMDEIRKMARRPKINDLHKEFSINRGGCSFAEYVLDCTPHSSPLPEKIAIANSFVDDICKALEILPRAQKKAVELRVFKGLSDREISDQLDRKLGTVKWDLHYGLANIRETLAPWGPISESAV